MSGGPFARVKVNVLKDLDPRAIDRLRARMGAMRRSVNVGIPAGPAESDGTPLALIAAVHEYGAPEHGIPERPFLRAAINENRAKYARLSQQALLDEARGQATPAQALGQLGEAAAGDVKNKITHGPFAPLAPATIKRKGSAKPLIDTGNLRQSVTWEIAND